MKGIKKGIYMLYTLSENLLKLLIFIKNFLYHYEYSRHNRPVSVFFNYFLKFQGDISFSGEM